MKRLMAGLGVVLAASLGVGLWLPAEQPDARARQPESRRSAAEERSTTLPPPVTSRAAPLVAPARPNAQPALTERDVQAHAELPLAAMLEALIVRLEQLDADRPDAFAAEAVAEMVAFHQSVASLDPEQRCDQLLARVRAGSLSDHVHAALLALLAAWGDLDGALTLAGLAGADHRAVVQGAGWALEADAQGLAIQPVSFFDGGMAVGQLALHVALERIPSEDMEDILVTRCLADASDDSGVFDRQLALLALGTTVDERPDVLDLFARLLSDRSPGSGQQAWPPILFVLSQARSDAAQALLQSLLSDPSFSTFGRSVVAGWMATEGGHDLITTTAAAFDDPSADNHDRVLALRGIMDRLPFDEDDPVEEIEAFLFERYDPLLDDPLSSGMVILIMSLPESVGRVLVLGDALLRSPGAINRLMAVRALGQAQGSFAVLARDRLSAALAGETDAGVRAAIEQALALLQGQG